MKKQEFDSLVKDAFSEAEVNPSRKVWTNIELELERAESVRMKRKLLFYKLLAAASVVFGLCLGGTGIFIMSERSEMISTMPDKPAAGNTSEVRAIAGKEEVNSVAGDHISGQLQPQQEDKKRGYTAGHVQLNEDESYATTSSYFTSSGSHIVNHNKKEEVTEGAHANVIHDEGIDPSVLVSDASGITSPERGKEIVYRTRNLPALVWKGKREPYIPKIKPDKLDLLLASLEIIEEKEQKDGQKKQKSGSNENLWASAGMSTGLFNTVNPSSGTAQSSLNFANLSSSPAALSDAVSSSRLGLNEYYLLSETANNTLKNERNAPGMAYSFGVQVGGKVANRWVVQSGLNYITQSTNYTSSVIVADPQRGTFFSATSTDFIKSSSNDNRYYATAPHKVNNNMQLVSLPVQAGFIALNKSVGIQVNGGISTDLFLQNTITPLGGANLDQVTKKGKDSAYRSVNFSGLFGTEFSYRFNERYRVAVNPGLRYPFNSIYKSEVGLESTPLTFDVGIKFRYVF